MRNDLNTDVQFKLDKVNIIKFMLNFTRQKLSLQYCINF